jgi:hypothetical protein
MPRELDALERVLSPQRHAGADSREAKPRHGRDHQDAFGSREA